MSAGQVAGFEELLVEWGEWCRDERPIHAREDLVSSIWRQAGGSSGRRRPQPRAVVGERVQDAVARMVQRHRRPELGRALGAWYAWALMATTTGPDHHAERVAIAAARCGVSVRTFPDLLVAARSAVADELQVRR